MMGSAQNLIAASSQSTSVAELTQTPRPPPHGHLQASSQVPSMISYSVQGASGGGTMMAVAETRTVAKIVAENFMIRFCFNQIRYWNGMLTD